MKNRTIFNSLAIIEKSALMHKEIISASNQQVHIFAFAYLVSHTRDSAKERTGRLRVGKEKYLT